MPTPWERFRRAEAISIEAMRSLPLPLSDQLGWVSDEVNVPLNVTPSGKLIIEMPPEPDRVTCSGLATTEPLKLSRPHESRFSEPVSWPVRLSSAPLGPKLARHGAAEVGAVADLEPAAEGQVERAAVAAADAQRRAGQRDVAQVDRAVHRGVELDRLGQAVGDDDRALELGGEAGVGQVGVDEQRRGGAVGLDDRRAVGLERADLEGAGDDRAELTADDRGLDGRRRPRRSGRRSACRRTRRRPRGCRNGRVGGDAVPHDRAVEAHVVGALLHVEHADEGGLVGGEGERAVGLVDDQVADDAAAGERGDGLLWRCPRASRCRSGRSSCRRPACPTRWAGCRPWPTRARRPCRRRR